MSAMSGCLELDCNGHGTCQMTSNTSEAGEVWGCVCSDGWTGKSDILSFEGFACNNSVLAIQITWGMVLLSQVLMVVKHIKAFKTQLPMYRTARTKAGKKGKTLHMWSHPPLKVVFIGLFINIPTLTAMSLIKVITQDGMCVNVAVSICLMFCGLGTFVANNINDERMFQMLAKGSGAPKAEMDKLTHFLSTRLWGSLSVYACAVLTSIAIGLSIGTGRDPRTSPMRYMLFIRNSAFVGFIATTAVVQKHLKKVVRELFGALSKQQSTDSTKAAKALAVLENSAADKAKAAVVSGIVYCTVSVVSACWPYQGFAVALFILLATVSHAHPINTLLGSGDDKKSASVNPDPNNSSTSGATTGSAAASDE